LDRTFTGWIAPALRLAHLLDHLVGEQLHRVGYLDALRPGRFQVDHKLEFADCTTGKSAGFSPENTPACARAAKARFSTNMMRRRRPRRAAASRAFLTASGKPSF